MASIPRRRITRALAESLERGIAIVVAPAGYGKSEALLAAFGDIGLPLVLPSGPLTIELVASAVYALTSERPATTLSQLLQEAADDERDAALAGWLATQLRGIDEPIVIDDFHRFHDAPDALHLITQLIDRTAPRVRWVIASREVPRIPVGSWLARDIMRMPMQITELAFTIDDTRELAALLDVEIPDADLRTIVDDAEGWPLVVRLAVSAWSRTRAIVPLRIRTNAVLFDYIEREIWSVASSDDRRLLVAAALLPNALPSLLVTAGFADARARLENLEERIPLIRITATGAYYLQGLFRDYIVARHADPETTTPIVAALAKSLITHGAVAQAVGLALRASDWTLTGDLLTGHGYELAGSAEHAVIHEAYERLPRANPARTIVTALRGIIRSNEGALSAAEADLRAVVDDPRLPLRLKRQVDLRLAQLSVNHGDPNGAIARLEAIVESDDLIESLDALTLSASAHSAAGHAAEANVAINRATSKLGGVSSVVKARLVSRIAFAHYYLGNLAAAETFALMTAELAEMNGLPALKARAYSVLQAIATVTNPDTVMAVRYIGLWVAAAKEAGERAGLAFALMALAWIAALRADDDLYDQSMADLRDVRVPFARQQNVALRWARVVHDAGVGKMREAIVTIRSVDTTAAGEATKALCAALEGTLCAAMEDRERADLLLRDNPLIVVSADPESRQHLAYAHAYRAFGLWLLGRSRLAQRALGRTPHDLDERDYVFLSVIRSICFSPRATMTHQKLELLTNAFTALDLQGHARFLRRLFSPVIAESNLSRLELDVLREFERGGTYAEVADRLHVPRRTVEKRLQIACRKLGCSGRTEAVEFAAGRGWLD